MAIFSLIHRSLGKGKNYVSGSPADHASYITRDSACSEIVGARMPTSRSGICAWLTEQEEASRKNGRLIDKVMVALPIELTHDQRVELVTDYCNAMTKGRASWVAAIHDKEPDADNPHAHIIFRDRDFETGRRVMFTSASAREAAELEATKGVEVVNTQAMRVQWAEHTNEMYERLGYDCHIDHRSLKAQGIDREPEQHRGPEIPLERFWQSEIVATREIAGGLEEESKRVGDMVAGGLAVIGVIANAVGNLLEGGPPPPTPQQQERLGQREAATEDDAKARRLAAFDRMIEQQKTQEQERQAQEAKGLRQEWNFERRRERD